MDALTNKVKAVDSALVVKELELVNKLHQCLMGFFEAFGLDVMLIDYADSEDQFAKVHIIDLQEDIIKNAWSKPIEIEQEFPSFVPARNFFCRITWRAIK